MEQPSINATIAAACAVWGLYPDRITFLDGGLYVDGKKRSDKSTDRLWLKAQIVQTLHGMPEHENENWAEMSRQSKGRLDRTAELVFVGCCICNHLDKQNGL